MQTSLLPLPVPFPDVRWHTHTKVSRSILRRAHSKMGWQSWANQGVCTVNQLNGVPGNPQAQPNRAQAAALSKFCSEYKDMGKPPLDFTPARAFNELCIETLPYLGGESGPAPYDCGKLSLPDVNSNPVSPECNLCAEHSNTLRGEGVPMLRSVSQAKECVADSGLARPHVDSAFHCPKTYASFLCKLQTRQLLEWQIGGVSLLGVFFVYKKDGRLRVIFDTRIVNCYFHDPPKTRLPTAASFTSIETTPGDEIYFGGGDIEKAFYRVKCPDIAKQFFTLPPPPPPPPPPLLKTLSTVLNVLKLPNSFSPSPASVPNILVFMKSMVFLSNQMKSLFPG